jgi:peptidoglycan/LPS O-acetylase OafA/YrhL
MFLLAIVFWALWVGLPQGLMGPVRVIREQSGVLALTLLGLVNLVPGYDLPPVGPWWYMPFVMQFYCLWPLLRRFAMRFGRGGLLILSVASLVLTYAANDVLVARWAINLLQTPLGHLPECCLGIAVARFNYRPGPVAASVSPVVFVVSNVLSQLWLLSFISGLVMIVWSYHVLQPVLRRSEFLVKVGGYSTALFLVNGFIRFPFLELAARAGVWYARLVYGVASVSFALTVALLLTAASTYWFGRLPALATARPESG